MIKAAGLIENPDPAIAQSVVNLTYAKLQAFINNLLVKNWSLAIRLGDLEQLTSLDLRRTGVTTLAGLEVASNIDTISVDINRGDYLSTDAYNLYAGLLEELNTMAPSRLGSYN